MLATVLESSIDLMICILIVWLMDYHVRLLARAQFIVDASPLSIVI